MTENHTLTEHATARRRDALLQQHVPAVMVPRWSNFAPLDEIGHRYLVAEDGLWIEVHRPWLHLVWPLAPTPMPLPYGPVLGDQMDFSFELGGAEFGELLNTFFREAARVMPNECAACFLWNTRTQSLEYRRLTATEASPGSVTYQRPALPDHLHLAVDIHSHGAGAPYFSETDDADDAGEVKLAVVIGNIGATGQPHYALRLCAHGLFIPFEDVEARA